MKLNANYFLIKNFFIPWLINPLFRYIIIIAIYMLLFICYTDTSLCYGDYSTEESDNRTEVIWGGELDGRPVIYEPYRPGLHATSQGYCYELDGTSRNKHSNGNYSNNFHGIYYTDSESSANIGEINPIDSEYYRDSYVVPVKNNLYTKVGFVGNIKNNVKKAAKWVKDDLEKTRIKAARDSEKSKALNRRIEELRNLQTSNRNRRDMKRLRDYHQDYLNKSKKGPSFKW